MCECVLIALLDRVDFVPALSHFLLKVSDEALDSCDLLRDELEAFLDVALAL